jgi:hypothetical protein
VTAVKRARPALPNGAELKAGTTQATAKAHKSLLRKCNT